MLQQTAIWNEILEQQEVLSLKLTWPAVSKHSQLLSLSSLTRQQARAVEVSETGALQLRQHSLFDILYKKQTVRTGCVHKHNTVPLRFRLMKNVVSILHGGV